MCHRTLWSQAFFLPSPSRSDHTPGLLNALDVFQASSGASYMAGNILLNLAECFFLLFETRRSFEMPFQDDNQTQQTWEERRSHLKFQGWRDGSVCKGACYENMRTQVWTPITTYKASGGCALWLRVDTGQSQAGLAGWLPCSRLGGRHFQAQWETFFQRNKPESVRAGYQRSLLSSGSYTFIPCVYATQTQSLTTPTYIHTCIHTLSHTHSHKTVVFLPSH